MNLEQEKMIAQMGIGPVWKLRSNSIEQTVSVQTLPSMNLPLEPNNQIEGGAQNGPDSGLHLLENNSICQTCGWCLVSSSGVQRVRATGANYFFVRDCPIDSDIEQALGMPSAADQLMKSILRELGIKIGVDAYVAGIVKTKPIKGIGRQFNDQESEVFLCLSCLKKQIELIRPVAIVSFGSIAAMSLLDMDANTPLGTLRGQLHRHDRTALIMTHELNYLLQHPKEKRDLWSDLCLALSTTSHR